jgi:hypothetical protein
MAAMYRAELSTSRRRNGMAPVARQSKNDSRRRTVHLTDTLQIFCGLVVRRRTVCACVLAGRVGVVGNFMVAFHLAHPCLSSVRLLVCEAAISNTLSSVVRNCRSKDKAGIDRLRCFGGSFDTVSSRQYDLVLHVQASKGYTLPGLSFDLMPFSACDADPMDGQIDARLAVACNHCQGVWHGHERRAQRGKGEVISQ